MAAMEVIMARKTIQEIPYVHTELPDQTHLVDMSTLRQCQRPVHSRPENKRER